MEIQKKKKGKDLPTTTLRTDVPNIKTLESLENKFLYLESRQIEVRNRHYYSRKS